MTIGNYREWFAAGDRAEAERKELAKRGDKRIGDDQPLMALNGLNELMTDEPWYGEFQRGLANTTRRDETALHARISELEQECERLRMRIAALEKANGVNP